MTPEFDDLRIQFIKKNEYLDKVFKVNKNENYLIIKKNGKFLKQVLKEDIDTQYTKMINHKDYTTLIVTIIGFNVGFICLAFNCRNK